MNKIVIEDSFYEIKLDNENDDIVFDLKDNLKSNILEINQDDLNKNYVFNVLSRSEVIIDIFDSASNVKRKIDINIDGEDSKVILNLSTISTNNNEYIINAFNNKKGNISITNIHGLSIDDSKLLITNNGYIKKGAAKSKLFQDNKIINMGENNSKIEPNLYIEEYDVEAMHGAYIGKFDEDTLFYLRSRGLSLNESYNLLIKGFLLEEFYKHESLKDDLINIINKYWR